MELTKVELLEINGGAVLKTITAAFVNAVIKGVNTLLDLGRSIGNSIRRAGENNLCPIP